MTKKRRIKGMNLGIRMPDGLVEWMDMVNIAKSRSEKIRTLCIMSLNELTLLKECLDSLNSEYRLALYNGASNSSEYKTMTVKLPNWLIDFLDMLCEKGIFINKSEALRALSIMSALKFVKSLSYEEGK